jgi:DNA-binding transcriptional MerR regulator
MNTVHGEPFLLTGDAARVLRISPLRVRQLGDAGVLSIAARTIDGTRLYRRADVEKLAAERAARKPVKGCAVVQ